MKRLMAKILAGVLVAAVCGSCRHKPSYSDIKVDAQGRLIDPGHFVVRSAPAAGPAGASGQTGDVTAIPTATAPVHPVPQAPPDFYDRKTAQIKDLPMVGHSKLVSMRFGPTAGYESMSIQAKVATSFDQVTAFYDAAIKAGGWSITANDRNSDTFTWQLAKRNGDDGATVQVVKDRQPGVTVISLIRMQKIEDSKPAPKS